MAAPQTSPPESLRPDAAGQRQLDQALHWQGVGPMRRRARKLHAYVAEAHANGYRVRFWATPDMPGAARDAVWNELFDAGVDHINTDDLARCSSS